MSRPSFQFYPSDWQANSNLRRCTHEEKGLWVDIMCLLHDQSEYGICRWSLKEIAQAVGSTLAKLRPLAAKGVLKGADAGAVCEAFTYVPRSGRKNGPEVTLIPSQSGPLWYSSRMVVDEYKRVLRGESGGGTNGGTEGAPNATPKPTPKGGLGAASKPAPEGAPEAAPEATPFSYAGASRAAPSSSSSSSSSKVNPNPPQPTLSEDCARGATPVELSIALRQRGVNCQPADPRLIAMSAQGVTVATALSACVDAETSKAGEVIPLGYVVKIIERRAAEAAAMRVAGANARASPRSVESAKDRARRETLEGINGYPSDEQQSRIIDITPLAIQCDS